MMFNEICELISVTISKDDLQQEIETETSRQIFCNKQSISMNEFYQAGQTDIKAAHKFVINSMDYKDEKRIRYKGKIFSIYRTFEKNDYIELYAEVRNGG